MDFKDDNANEVGLEDEAQFETSLVNGETAHLPQAEILDASHHGSTTHDSVGGSSIIRRPDWVGKKFGRFKLLRMLGEGSMGRVILAEDVNLHRILALKVLRKRIKGMDDGQAVQQFLREARGAALIDHPNVVRIYEINEHDGWWYIAMELVEGQTLQQVVKAVGPLSPHRACVIIGDAATALEVAHEHGIIHRDIKPSNLMITRQGHCKLTDFGLVRLDAAADPFDLHDRSVGTPKFMAPEVIQRKQQGPLLDIYSLGATLYFALTGKPPYVGEKVSHILKQHMESPAPDLRKVVADCPESLAALLQRMMAKNPDERPSAADAAAALHAEAVGFRDDASGWTATGGMTGTSGATSPSGMTHTTAIGGSTVNIVTQPIRVRRRIQFKAVMYTLSTLSLLGAVLVFAYWFLTRPASTTDAPGAAAFAELFPEAPQTYGLREAGDLPKAVSPLEKPPAMSWRLKLDPSSSAFVAHSEGKYFYPADSAEAALIPSDKVEGFNSAQEARAKGKLPAPK
ncbi:MAG: serine/threonine-protein kinase [Phycisphaeraceae bacterium]